MRKGHISNVVERTIVQFRFNQTLNWLRVTVDSADLQTASPFQIVGAAWLFCLFYRQNIETTYTAQLWADYFITRYGLLTGLKQMHVTDIASAEAKQRLAENLIMAVTTYLTSRRIHSSVNLPRPNASCKQAELVQSDVAVVTMVIRCVIADLMLNSATTR